MEIDKIKITVEKLGTEFDSHSFIRRLLETCPSVYGELFMKYNNVTIVDAQIAIYLLNHASELRIKKIQDNLKSTNILGNNTPNSLWRKEVWQ